MTEIIDTPPEVFISRRVVPGLVGTGFSVVRASWRR